MENEILNGVALVGEIVKETEKAVNICFKYWTTAKSPIKYGYMWCPKKCMNKVDDTHFVVWRKGVNDWVSKYNSACYGNHNEPNFNFDYYEREKTRLKEDKAREKAENNRISKIRENIYKSAVDYYLPVAYRVFNAFKNNMIFFKPLIEECCPNTRDAFNAVLDKMNEINIPNEEVFVKMNGDDKIYEDYKTTPTTEFRSFGSVLFDILNHETNFFPCNLYSGNTQIFKQEVPDISDSNKTCVIYNSRGGLEYLNIVVTIGDVFNYAKTKNKIVKKMYECYDMFMSNGAELTNNIINDFNKTNNL